MTRRRKEPSRNPVVLLHNRCQRSRVAKMPAYRITPPPDDNGRALYACIGAVDLGKGLILRATARGRSPNVAKRRAAAALLTMMDERAAL